MNSRSRTPLDSGGRAAHAILRIGILVLMIFALGTNVYSVRTANAEPGADKVKQATYKSAPWLNAKDVETPFMKVGLNSEPWLTDVLADIKAELSDIMDGLEYLYADSPKDPRLRVVGTFTNIYGRDFVATEWKVRKKGAFSSLILLHSVFYPTGERLNSVHFEKEIHNYGTTLAHPTGYPLAPGENPAIIVKTYHGGSSSSSGNLRLIVLDDMPIDVTPEWLEVRYNLRDLNDDGARELTGALIYWDDVVPECDYSCNHVVYTILTRRDGKWVPACREFASSQQDLLKSGQDYIDQEKSRKDGKGWIFRAVAHQALRYAQIGDHKTALQYGKEAAEVSGNPSHPILAFLRKAQSLGNYQCPVSAAKTDDPHWRVR
jgi:hypothetical protein